LSLDFVSVMRVKPADVRKVNGDLAPRAAQGNIFGFEQFVDDLG